MHKLSSHSFETEDGDTVKGHIVVTPPEDGNYEAGRNIGTVAFVVDNDEQEDEDEKPSKKGKKEDRSVTTPRGTSQQNYQQPRQ